MKKILSNLMAFVLMFVFLCGGVAKADYPTSEYWYTTHTKYPGAPAYTGTTATKSIAYSTKGATVNVASLSVSIPGASGYVEVISLTGVMPALHLNSIGGTDVNPVHTGIIYCSTFKFSAFSNTNGSTYSGSGNVVTKP